MQGWEKLGVPWVAREAAIHKGWLIGGWLSSKSGGMRGTSFFWKMHEEYLGSCHEKAGIQHYISSVRAMWCSLLSVTRDCMQVLPCLPIAPSSPTCLPGFHLSFRTLNSYKEGKEQLHSTLFLRTVNKLYSLPSDLPFWLAAPCSLPLCMAQRRCQICSFIHSNIHLFTKLY